MKKESLKSKAYNYIKDKIITCQYEPGDFLDERHLIQEIDVSRTPIREALNKLEQENLIKILPKKGVVVTQITLKNIVDVYQVRELIEPAAILNHSENISYNKIIYFKEVFENIKNNLSNIQAYDIDDDFHRYFIACHENDYINNIMEEIRIQNQRIRILTGRNQVNCLDNSIEEHLEIISYILDNKFIEAAESLRKHILLSKKRTMDIMQRI